MYSRDVLAFEICGFFVSICAFAKRSVTVYIFGTCSVSICTFGVSIYLSRDLPSLLQRLLCEHSLVR